MLAMTVSAELLLPLPLPGSDRPGACVPVLSVCVGGLRARCFPQLWSTPFTFTVHRFFSLQRRLTVKVGLPACLPASGRRQSVSREHAHTVRLNTVQAGTFISELRGSSNMGLWSFQTCLQDISHHHVLNTSDFYHW